MPKADFGRTLPADKSQNGVWLIFRFTQGHIPLWRATEPVFQALDAGRRGIRAADMRPIKKRGPAASVEIGNI